MSSNRNRKTTPQRGGALSSSVIASILGTPSTPAVPSAMRRPKYSNNGIRAKEDSKLSSDDVLVENLDAKTITGILDTMVDFVPVMESGFETLTYGALYPDKLGSLRPDRSTIQPDDIPDNVGSTIAAIATVLSAIEQPRYQDQELTNRNYDLARSAMEAEFGNAKHTQLGFSNVTYPATDAKGVWNIDEDLALSKPLSLLPSYAYPNVEGVDKKGNAITIREADPLNPLQFLLRNSLAWVSRQNPDKLTAQSFFDFMDGANANALKALVSHLRARKFAPAYPDQAGASQPFPEEELITIVKASLWQTIAKAAKNVSALVTGSRSAPDGIDNLKVGTAIPAVAQVVLPNPPLAGTRAFAPPIVTFADAMVLSKTPDVSPLIAAVPEVDALALASKAAFDNLKGLAGSKADAEKHLRVLLRNAVILEQDSMTGELCVKHGAKANRKLTEALEFNLANTDAVAMDTAIATAIQTAPLTGEDAIFSMPTVQVTCGAAGAKVAACAAKVRHLIRKMKVLELERVKPKTVPEAIRAIRNLESLLEDAAASLLKHEKRAGVARAAGIPQTSVIAGVKKTTATMLAAVNGAAPYRTVFKTDMDGEKDAASAALVGALRSKKLADCAPELINAYQDYYTCAIDSDFNLTNNNPTTDDFFSDSDLSRSALGGFVGSSGAIGYDLERTLKDSSADKVPIAAPVPDKLSAPVSYAHIIPANVSKAIKTALKMDDIGTFASDEGATFDTLQRLNAAALAPKGSAAKELHPELVKLSAVPTGPGAGAIVVAALAALVAAKPELSNTPLSKCVSIISMITLAKELMEFPGMQKYDASAPGYDTPIFAAALDAIIGGRLVLNSETAMLDEIKAVIGDAVNHLNRIDEMAIPAPNEQEPLELYLGEMVGTMTMLMRYQSYGKSNDTHYEKPDLSDPLIYHVYRHIMKNPALQRFFNLIVDDVEVADIGAANNRSEDELSRYRLNVKKDDDHDYLRNSLAPSAKRDVRERFLNNQFGGALPSFFNPDILFITRIPEYRGSGVISVGEVLFDAGDVSAAGGVSFMKNLAKAFYLRDPNLSTVAIAGKKVLAKKVIYIAKYSPYSGLAKSGRLYPIKSTIKSLSLNDRDDPALCAALQQMGTQWEVEGSVLKWQKKDANDEVYDHDNCAFLEGARDDAGACNSFIAACIRGKDCHQLMTVNIDIPTDQDEMIEKMAKIDPIVARDILLKWGFGVTVSNDNPRGVDVPFNRIETVSSWLGRLRKRVSCNTGSSGMTCQVLDPEIAAKVVHMSNDRKKENFFKYLRALVCVVDNNDIALNTTLASNRRVSGSSTLFHPKDDPRYLITDVTQVVRLRQVQSNMLCMRMSTMYGGDPGYFNNPAHFLMMLRTLRRNQGSHIPMGVMTSTGFNVPLIQNPMLRAVPRSAVNIVTNNLTAYAQKLSVGNKVALSSKSTGLVNNAKKNLESAHQKLITATQEVIRQFEDIELSKHFRGQYDINGMNERQKKYFRDLMARSKQRFPEVVRTYHSVSNQYNDTMKQCQGLVSFLKNLYDGGVADVVHQYDADSIY